MTAIFSRTKALPKCLRCIGGQLAKSGDDYGMFECIQCGARYNPDLHPVARQITDRKEAKDNV